MAVSPSLGLLARKGEARPAMRSQPLAAPAAGPRDAADLDWTSMRAAPLPAVLVERARLAAQLSCAPDPTVPVDADRHRRLQDAARTTGCTAQALVGDALDMLFATLPAAGQPATTALATGD